MKTNFDNQAFLNLLAPNMALVEKLKNQRNWAIGISVALFAGLGYYAFVLRKENMQLKLSKQQ